MNHCQGCKYAGAPTLMGAGSTSPKIIWVSEHPTQKEITDREPMTSRAGSNVTRALTNIVGLNLERDVFFTYMVHCDTQGAPKPDHITSCRSWIQAELKDIECDLIVLSGGLVFQHMLPAQFDQEKANDKDFNGSHAHGRTYQHQGKTYFVTLDANDVERYKFKDPRRKIGRDFADWYPTGSLPWVFIRDMNKLKALIDQRYGVPVATLKEGF